MTDPVISLSEQRLIRRAPDRLIALDQSDWDYLAASLRLIADEFGVEAAPSTPLHLLPARSLMRRLLDLRRSLKPQTQEQRAILGRLASAILRLDTACAFYRALEEE